MTDLLHTIPDFPTKNYTHLIPSLEKSLITTTDLLTLDALDVAKRAQLPLLEVRRLKEHVLALLQSQLGLDSDLFAKFDNVGSQWPDYGLLRKNGHQLAKPRGCISTLDPTLDEALGGGIQTGYLTEITGESGAGKTQLLLTLLLSAQLSPPNGLARPTCYISTEHPLPTTRLQQILTTHPTLTTAPTPPTLSHILTLQTPDLESQDHILTYQLPHALTTHNLGLIIIDSIAANYRAEATTASGPRSSSRHLAARSAQLVTLSAHLRSLAREHDCAIVVANQVSDRFAPAPSASTAGGATAGGAFQDRQSHHSTPLSSSPPHSSPTTTTTLTTTTPTAPILTLDHQQRFFTGWGDAPPPHSLHTHNLKTPSLGLVWANQIACRIALVKEESVHQPQQQAQTSPPTDGGGGADDADRGGGGAGTTLAHIEEFATGRAEWAPRRWRRWMRVVFAAWVGGVDGGERGVEFEVWGGGLRGVGEGR